MTQKTTSRIRPLQRKEESGKGLRGTMGGIFRGKRSEGERYPFALIFKRGRDINETVGKGILPRKAFALEFVWGRECSWGGGGGVGGGGVLDLTQKMAERRLIWAGRGKDELKELSVRLYSVAGIQLGQDERKIST